MCAARPPVKSVAPGISELKEEYNDLSSECKAAEEDVATADAALQSANTLVSDCEKTPKCSPREGTKLAEKAKAADLRLGEAQAGDARCQAKFKQLGRDTAFISQNSDANKKIAQVKDQVKMLDEYIQRCELADNADTCPPEKLNSLRVKKNAALVDQMKAEMHKKSLAKKYPALIEVRAIIVSCCAC